MEVANNLPRRRPGRKLSNEERSFIGRRLAEMNRIAEDCIRLKGRMDELQPRFAEAALQKAKVLLGVWAVGFLLFAASFYWTGIAVVSMRIALICSLISLYFLPVHFFVHGALRADAHTWRKLNRRGLSSARQLARIGDRLNRDLQEMLACKRRPAPSEQE